jgi:ectoine hydroxylase-related dioxygenase (phytanoyl-CoA dioxygenase family)
LTCYQEDGFFVREAVFGAQELVLLRDAADRAVAVAQQLSERGRTYHLDGKRFVDVDHVTIQFEHVPGSEQVRVIEPVHELDGRFDALIDDPRIVRPMSGLIGQERVALWTAKLNLKVAGNGSGFGWHQDSPYWIHDCAHVDLLPNVMVAFDEASEANGCLRVVRGSHRQGCLPGTSDGTQLGGFFTSPDHFDESQQVALEVPAGSLIFFSPHVVHGSQPNQSAQPRRAIVLTYQPGDQPMLKNGRVRNALGP